MEHTNKLINEKSPYLLQHAHNPVNWYPWSSIALEKAKAEDKPIFLSIGYSTCHWCHVMERESFEDEQVADLLNQHFISIKVDREERPDVDHIYMSVCQALTGQGGWPLTIFMTPDQKPFFAGTYFPKGDRMGMTGFLRILEVIAEEWQTNRRGLMQDCEKIFDAVKEQSNTEGELSEDLPDLAFIQFKRAFDQSYGGFGGAPKFPAPHNLMFLLRYWHITGEKSALDMVEKTLDAMYRGGIYDHIGFGFSRYSTDKKWLAPHFEKMLYDNALLAMMYLETYQAAKDAKYAQVADEIFAYVLRDMTSPEGGFYSAEDADSEGEEGKFYLWTPEEVKSVLGEADGKAFCERYDITQAGNFEGKSIANLIGKTDGQEDQELLEQCRRKLFEHREKRVHPHKDDKILTSWNGLMIAALAIGGRVMDNPGYTTAAERCAAFLLQNLVRPDGRLLARYRDGHTAFTAYADDYAFLIWALIELYETTYKAEYLQKAMELNRDLLKLFWDENGGLFVYGSDAEQLITRPKEIYDGATPSANAVCALNLLRLARITGENGLEDRAHLLLHAFSGSIGSVPRGHTFSLIALLFAQAKTKEVVLVPDETTRHAKQLVRIINSDFHPFVLSVMGGSGEQNPRQVVPFIQEYTAVGGKATAYVCQNFTCKAPVTDAAEFMRLLED